MTVQEYFRDWWTVIDHNELQVIMTKLTSLYNTTPCTPVLKNIFKAFELCSKHDCQVVFIGQDPYPQKGIATGVAFANEKNVKELSPSLKIIKDCIMDFENPHNIRIFDPTLESIAKQGVLFLNTTLTVEVNKPNSHQLIWRRFMEYFIKHLCEVSCGLVFVLLGTQAQSFKPFINKYQHIVECAHPSYYARTDTKMPNIFADIDSILIPMCGKTIQWYTTI